MNAAVAPAPVLTSPLARPAGRPAPKTLPWIVSVAFHVLLVVGGLFAQRAEFGVDPGKNSVEVNLVAASREETPSATEQTVEPVSLDPDPMVSKPQPAPPKPKTPHVAQKEHGDGSSPKPGKDATTAKSEAGAIPSVQPDYLRNPPPTYPEEARRQKEEGLVVLEVVVGAEGTPESVAVTASSGHALLDQAAVKAVRGWRFRPAVFAGMKTRSRAQVPVRFRLDA